MITTPTARATRDTENAPDQGVASDGQTVIEVAQFNNGAPVFDSGKTRVVAGGAQTATQRTNSASGGIPTAGQNAGVIVPHDDKTGSFPGDTAGKPVAH